MAKNANDNFNFFKATMPDSRKSTYHLGCLEGAVFMDFDVTPDKRIALVRISFDGYGSCELSGESVRLDVQCSKEFIELMKNKTLDQEKVKHSVLELIRLNQDAIWTDALETYSFVNSSR